jgi:mono/diheme cytochrome c family protein
MTAVGQTSSWTGGGAAIRVAPGNPDGSTVYYRMGVRDMSGGQMPPVATEMVDTEGRAAIAAWISSL